ncbi:MAG TPA: hypothetical protein VIF11_01290 [Methylomirabilota bacterium]|jgi:hypothetical protein
MKRTAVLFAAGLTLLLSGPALAKDPSYGTSSGTTGATAPAEKPGMLAMPHHVTGNVVAVDKKANSVSIKDTKGKEYTLVADGDTVAALSRLKVGDEVKATYKKDKEQMVATKITTVASTTPRSK